MTNSLLCEECHCKQLFQGCKSLYRIFQNLILFLFYFYPTYEECTKFSLIYFKHSGVCLCLFVCFCTSKIHFVHFTWPLQSKNYWSVVRMWGCWSNEERQFYVMITFPLAQFLCELYWFNFTFKRCSYFWWTILASTMKKITSTVLCQNSV